MKVLHHKNARWGIGALDLDQLVVASCPQFLYPFHEQQVRMPIVPTLWYPNGQTAHSINPAVLTGYHGLNNHGHQLDWERIHSQHDHNGWLVFAGLRSSPIVQLPSQFKSPFLEPSIKFSHCANASDKLSIPQLYHDVPRISRQTRLHKPWEKTSYSNWCVTTRLDALPKRTLLLVEDPFQPPAPLHAASSSHLASPIKDILSDADPSELGNLFAVPIGQLASDMPPSAGKRNRKGSATHIKADEEQREASIGLDSGLPPLVTRG